MNTCIYCQITFGNPGALAVHQPHCKSNPDRVQRKKSPNAHAKKGSTGWSKGLTKDTDERIKARPEYHGRRFGASLHGHTESTKQRLSEVAKERKLGGYVKGSGRGKKGWYRGYFCDSSWELAFVIYHMDQGSNIKRSNEKRSYYYQDKLRNYYPDFNVNDTLYEVKGYRTAQWEAKIKANPDVKVLYEIEMKPILKYVVDKYGKDYIKLYE